MQLQYASMIPYYKLGITYRIVTSCMWISWHGVCMYLETWVCKGIFLKLVKFYPVIRLHILHRYMWDVMTMVYPVINYIYSHESKASYLFHTHLFYVSMHIVFILKIYFMKSYLKKNRNSETKKKRFFLVL